MNRRAFIRALLALPIAAVAAPFMPRPHTIQFYRWPPAGTWQAYDRLLVANPDADKARLFELAIRRVNGELGRRTALTVHEIVRNDFGGR